MAHQNPGLRVWYVMTAAAVEGSDGLATSLVQRYPNLRPVTADLRRLFADTPLQQIYNTCAWCYNTSESQAAWKQKERTFNELTR